MNHNLAFSRPWKTATILGELAEDRHRFLDKRVLLTGEAELLKTTNGRDAFLYSLRLLVRICANVFVFLPNGPANLIAEAEQVAAQVAFGKPVEFPSSADSETFNAILSVGTRVHSALPWTTINSNGWRARVSSGDTSLAGECSLENPIGALACSCLGVGEVFKRLVALVPERGALLDGKSFSLYDFDANSEECGPPLPAMIEEDLLVVGAGAIGNGIAALLCRLPISGAIEIVDRERFGEENLGTCLLIGPEHLNQPKAPTLARMLKTVGKRAQGFECQFTDYVSTLDGKYPAVVLNGLDNIDVRHEVQRALWPDLIVDGAIGDFGCQVSRHPWHGEDIACLICLFRKPVRSGETVAAEATGLAEDRIRQPQKLVTNEDVDAAPEEKKEYLRSRVGKPVCSVVSESVTQKLSQDALSPGFEPSVPFVAAFSACMVVAQAITHIAGWLPTLEARFQFDFLRGPARGEHYPQGRREGCLCNRRKNIGRLRAAHGLID
jgi:molybdopterin/thiamine biosynthesis adenylyltransferase